jgi:hypothetical protein
MSAALVMALMVSGQVSGPRVDLELDFAYGYGSRTALGGLVGATAGWQVWETPGAAGTLDAGLLAGYQNEPYALSAAFLAPAVMTGSTHRFEAFAVVGHTARLLASRRLLVGVQGFAGWTQVAMRGTLTDSGRGVSGAYRADAAEFTFGLTALLGVRLTERVTLVGRFLLPVPYAGVAISSYFTAALGVAVRL